MVFIESFIIHFTYIAVFFLLAVNGIIGFPSSQLVCVFAGYFSNQNLNVLMVIIFASLGNFLGNVILYEISRYKGLKFILNISKKMGYDKFVNEQNINKTKKIIEKKPLLYIFLGKLVNPVKLFINIPAGIVKIRRDLFYTIILITSFIWCTLFTLLGKLFGTDLKFALLLSFIMLFIGLIVMYLFYREFNKN